MRCIDNYMKPDIKHKTSLLTYVSSRKELYEAFLQSDLWKRLRIEVFERDNWKCKLCHESGGLHAHHITYKHPNYDDVDVWDYTPNIITVCADCHKSLHRKGGSKTIAELQELVKRLKA